MRRNWKVVAWKLAAWLGLGSGAWAQFPMSPYPPQGGACGPNGCPPTLTMPCPGPVPFEAGMPGVPGLDRRAAATAFSGDCGPEYPAACFQISIEHLFLWFKGIDLPFPTLTTGSIIDNIPGAIGQPNTRVLFGGGTLGSDLSAGFRLKTTYWVVDPELLAVDCNFFINEQRSTVAQFASDTTGEPILTRPFYNPASNQNETQAVASTLNRFGYTTDVALTRFMGGEANLRWNLSGVPGNSENPCWSFITGFRWFRLDEKYFNRDHSTSIQTGVRSIFEDNFTTYNNIFAGQVGMMFHCRWDRLSLDLLGKVAVGGNNQTIEISGATTMLDPATGTISFDPRLGTYAQPSNIGQYRRNTVTILPEFAVNMGIDLTERWKLNIGYNLIIATNVIRPGDQMDPRVIPGALNLGQVAAFPTPPNFSSDSFWIQFINLGFEFIF